MKWTKKQLDDLEKIIGATFKNKPLLKNAFIHRSYLNEHKDGEIESNEKLEFLGDSVLSLVTSQVLFTRYQNLHEGEYTNIKASLVRTESLAEAAKNLNLGSFLFLSKGEEDQHGRNNTSILADCFEALIGAIFLENGLDSAASFIDMHLFKNKLATIVGKRLYNSVKNELQEYLQENYKMLPEYNTLEEFGPEHDKHYKVGVFFKGKVLGTGTGRSKKHAEENAASVAMQKIKKF